MQVCTLPLFLKQPSLASFQFFPSDCQNNFEKIHTVKKLQCLKAKPHSNCDKNLNCNHLEMDVYPLFGQ